MTDQHKLLLDKSVSLLNTRFSHHLENTWNISKNGNFFPSREKLLEFNIFLEKNLESENGWISKSL